MGEMSNAHNILHSGSYYLVAGRVVHREDILRYDDKKGVLSDVNTWADTPPKAKVEGGMGARSEISLRIEHLGRGE